MPRPKNFVSWSLYKKHVRDGDEESEREPVITESAEHVVLENAEYLGS